MRAGARSIGVLVGVAALGVTAVGHSQGPTVSRGLFRGSLPPDATGGLIRGTGDGSTGLLRGAVAPGTTSGLLTGSAPAPVGSVGGPIRRDAIIQPELLRGAMPPGTTVGALPQPAPPEARLGDPGPRDVAGFLESQARLKLIRGGYSDAEAHLRESVAVLEGIAGPDSPEVVQALESNAALLRQYDRTGAATEMESQAADIRARQERTGAASAAPTPAP